MFGQMRVVGSPHAVMSFAGPRGFFFMVSPATTVPDHDLLARGSAMSFEPEGQTLTQPVTNPV